MKTWFWTLLVFVAAVALALVLREHSGNVLIIAQPYRIELSLTLAVLLLLASFLVLYIVLRVLAWISHSPGRFRSWRGLRAEKRDHELLENGWIHILEGRYTEAEKDLSKVLGRTRSGSRKVLAALASARAAHHMGEFERRDEALAQAREHASENIRLREAASIVAAEMYLDQNRPQDALVLLQPLQDASSRYFHATRLLLRAHRQLRNHDRVYELTRLLSRRGVIDKAEAQQLIEVSAAARLRQGGPENLKSIWSDLKSDERALPDIALAAAAIHTGQGNHDEAAKVLEAALNVRLDARLLNAYSQCPPEHVARRLSKAEEWLKTHPDDSALLAALGNLCLTGELWGPGEQYLLRSMKLRSDMRIHALLGNLYDRLGRPADATTHWRLASSVAGVLPVLPASRALPAADTRGDPTLIDVEHLPQAKVLSTLETPLAASAADFSDYAAADTAADAPAAGADEPRAAAPATPKAAGDDVSAQEEYFDSSPFVGIDLTQTSDRDTSRGSGNH
ncbi:heme biosynthesis HemY N-terminal domain-containing protein [Parapusillimonas granuli]|uniref:Heme biosynthesis protein HemY n=1 Tax=Parapusillimonas granuli TaxID=380911 RepID=A0A853G7T6_9BURK|nr:heme biosynthesis HemY N-terminal domain-containing protein [Parapusillimonas granuli]MBB5217196.1 HemY protein [Parapusillimonas granuli]MEB2399210.1 heme biosynthesis protein HemY [Alcaligenaceae bacterium]NYT51010.1 heme biosynthesis protein HemY [Parapusillimonas granuli]